MKYDCYKGGKHIGDLKVGSRSVLAVCKGGNPVWRRPYTLNYALTNNADYILLCDCSSLKFSGWWQRASHGYANLYISINGTQVFNSGGASSDGVKYPYEYTYTGKLSAGAIIKFWTDGKYHSGTSTVEADGFYPIP